ncbi:ankyrin repeat domain-containing protein 31-like isoform X5 [Epinephelus fuscoguttatus]|uniref:ankyrin repeat domain-containing protein 31-like isoform X5 n=1 Tax=Epinephelus fuscoguttatus TaxID=293821 RepID=UPI0020D0B5AC|nr:ankyrin repeat domain-containing protein 31-like isoform X5 [Epinephelus fuscoguttatus]
METNRLKPPEQEMSSCNQSAAGHAESSSQSAEKVSQSVKIPNKMQLNKRSGTGETLLHKVCRKKDLTQVKILIQAGISINMQDYAGWTALHEASAVGAKAVVEELLNAGANVDARNYDGVTPLHDAVNSGHYEVVKLLLQHGSNPSDRNHGGLSALDIAEEEDIKALLSLSMSSATHEQPCKASAQYRQPDYPPAMIEQADHSQASQRSRLRLVITALKSSRRLQSVSPNEISPTSDRSPCSSSPSTRAE